MSRMYYIFYTRTGHYTSYAIGSSPTWQEFEGKAIFEHPLAWIKRIKDSDAKSVVKGDISTLVNTELLSWQELTEEEIELLDL